MLYGYLITLNQEGVSQRREMIRNKNKNTLDDRIENLELMKNRSAHFSLHKKEYWKQWRLKRQCV